MEADQQRTTSQSDKATSGFSACISGDTPVLVDFYADRCTPCNTMSGILEDVKSQVGAGVKILKVNIEKNPQLTPAYRIKSLPTLLLFRNGKIRWRWSGVVLADELLRVLRSVEPQKTAEYGSSKY